MWSSKPSSYVLTLQLRSWVFFFILTKRTPQNGVFDACQSCRRRRVAKWEQHEKLPQNSCCTKTEAIESEERNQHLRAEMLCRRDNWKTEGGKNIHLPSFFFWRLKKKLWNHLNWHKTWYFFKILFYMLGRDFTGRLRWKAAGSGKGQVGDLGDRVLQVGFLLFINVFKIFWE